MISGLHSIYESALTWWNGPQELELAEPKLEEDSEVAEEPVMSEEPAADSSTPNEQVQETETERTFYDKVEDIKNYGLALKEKGIVVYKDMTTTPESQKRMLSVAKSTVDLVSVYFGFYGTVFGAALGAWKPRGMMRVCKLVDDIFTDSIEQWSFQEKMTMMVGCTIIVVGASYLWLPIVPTVCTIYSMKIGAEVAFNNMKFFDEKQA